MSNPYQNALDIQGACNLGAIVRQFGRDICAVQEETRGNPNFTEAVAKHPIVRLYLEQLAFLAGLSLRETDLCTTYFLAYETCLERTKEKQTA